MAANTIKLGKTKYPFKFSFQAMAEFEKSTGHNLMIQGPMNLNTQKFSQFVHAMIEPDKNGKKPSLQEIQGHLDLSTITTINDTLMDAWADSFPKPDLGDENAARAFELLKTYFRVSPKQWKPDAYDRMRKYIDIMERARTHAGEDEDHAGLETEEDAEGNASSTGESTSQ